MGPRSDPTSPCAGVQATTPRRGRPDSRRSPCSPPSLSECTTIHASDYYVEVDGGAGGGSIDECDESNNSDLLTDAACPD